MPHDAGHSGFGQSGAGTVPRIPQDLGLFDTLSRPAIAALRAGDRVVSFGASLNPGTTGESALLEGRR